jgi:hypothetical protein
MQWKLVITEKEVQVVPTTTIKSKELVTRIKTQPIKLGNTYSLSLYDLS